PRREHGPLLDLLAGLDRDERAERDRVAVELAALGVLEQDLALAVEDDVLALLGLDHAQLRVLHDAFAARLHLGDGELARRDAADVERAHGQLRAGLADRLRADDPDREAELAELAARQVHAVAELADAQGRLAGQRAAHADLRVAELLDLLGDLVGEELALLHHDFAGDDVLDLVARDAAADELPERDLEAVALVDRRLRDAGDRAAVVHGEHDVLRDVGELARQVAGVGRLERGVGEALARAVRRAEVLEHVQAFAEVGADRGLDDAAVRLGHQPAHAGELADLLDRAAGARVDHDPDRIEVGQVVLRVVLQPLHHLLADLLARVRPDVDDLVVALTLRDDAVGELLLDLLDLLVRVGQDRDLLLRDVEVGDGERDAGAGRRLEAELLQAVEQLDGRVLSGPLVDVLDQARDALLVERHVEEDVAVGERVVQDQAADRRLGQPLGRLVALLGADAPVGSEADLHACVQRHLLVGVRAQRLVLVLEALALALVLQPVDGEVVAAEHDVLRRRDDRAAVRGAEDVVRRHHQRRGLDLRLVRQRQVHGHLVAVEVGVVAGADQRVDLDRVALDEHRLEGLDAHAVQRRRAVQQDRVALDDLLEDVPDLGLLAVEHLLRRLDGVGVAELLQTADDERLEELERDLLGQAALVELELRPDHDDRARAVVDALAEQVLAEAPLLALDHVGERLERAVARAEHRTAAAAVVEQRIDRLLQHPLLVA